MKPSSVGSPTLSALLHSTGSLTALLEKKAGRALSVEVVFEGLLPLQFAQKHALHLPKNKPQLAWQREVLLFGDDDLPWVRANSVFPLTSLQGDAKRLRYLKNTPIGYVLFKHQKTLPHTRTLFAQEDKLGRHTVYDWHGRTLLITELFLGDFFDTKKPNAIPCICSDLSADT